MLHLIVKPGLSARSQMNLYELFLRRRDNKGLALLAGLEDLDKDLDAKLAKVNASIVRAKWITRPGRSLSEIRANLCGEKRVRVLTDLVALDLNKKLYEVIAASNDSYALALAIVGNEASSRRAREIAARNLATYVSKSDTDVNIKKYQNSARSPRRTVRVLC